MIFPSFIGGLSLHTDTYKKMRADQVVEVIVSAGPVSPMDIPPMVPSVFFPMSVEAIDIENMSDVEAIVITEIEILSDSESDSDDVA